MGFQLYDLAGYRDDLRYSPFCWRTKMSLAHKGIEAEVVPWRQTEKDRIAFSGQGLVPVLTSAAQSVHDSWRIAEYLDDTFPEQPMLFEGREARALSLFVKFWVEQKLHPLILRTFLPDQLASLHEKDKETFRAVREKRFGTQLENIIIPLEEGRKAINETVSPARSVLDGQAFMAGSSPAFADYILFGALQWQRIISREELFEPSDPIHAWRERVLDLFGGFARSAPRRTPE